MQIKRLALVLAFAAAAVLSIPSVALAASPFDALLAKVPKAADLVVAVDHGTWSKHKHYARLLKFLAKQKWAIGLDQDAASGLEAGTAIEHSVTFRLPNNARGVIVSGKIDAAKVQTSAEGRLSAIYETGKASGKTWFVVADGLRAADLGGGQLVIGSKSAIEAALAGGGGVEGRAGFTALRKEASDGKPVMWAVHYLPKTTRAGLEAQGAGDMATVDKLTLNVSGKSDLTVKVVAHASGDAEAKAVVDGINSKLERKIRGNSLMRTLGVAALTERISISNKGKLVVASMPLTNAQVGLIAKLGNKIVKTFK